MAFRTDRTDTAERETRFTVETYPLKSVSAAEKMARKEGDNQTERAEFARTLLEESKAQGSYISKKNNRITRKAG